LCDLPGACSALTPLYELPRDLQIHELALFPSDKERMPLTAILLVLLGALIHAGWNIAAKKAHGDARFTFFSAAIMFVVWTPLCIWLGWNVVPT
jgi:hypothetical protein